MIGIDVEYRVTNKLPELSRALSVPLRDLTRALASRIRSRVRDEGKSAQLRRFSRLGTYRNSTGRGQDAQAKWWVRPDAHQPAGWLYRVTEGEFAGWAVYENLRKYVSLLPARMQWRRMDRTGATWAAMKVRVMARNRMKVAFYGTKKTSARAKSRVAYGQVAYLSVRHESPPNVLAYSDEDEAWFIGQIEHQLTTNFRQVLLGSAAGAAVPRRGVQGWVTRPTVRQI